MKKEIFIFIVILIIFSAGLLASLENSTITGKTITGEVVTGKATDASLAMRVALTMGVPSLNIISPKNNTYISTNDTFLNYSALYTNTVWYNLDGGTNQTISSYIIINASEGNHILYLYANNSDGDVVFRNVTFRINSSVLKVVYSKFASYDKGESTNFNATSFEDLQNLSNLILEKTYGKINFNDNTNITTDDNSSDYLVNFDANVNISSNRIELNSTALPNLNKSATLYLYGLTFTNPVIFRDGALCPDSICSKESYVGGTLKFNVTQFSVYSANETPGGTTIIITGGGSSSGGGGIIGILKPKVPSFRTDQENIKVSAVPGRVVTKKLIITNILNKSINLTLSQKNMSNFLVLKETQLTLAKGESKEISFNFVVSTETAPDLYIGKLIIADSKNDYVSEMTTIVEVESEGAMLDVGVKIPPEYFKITSGKDILAQINLFNVGTITGKRDILLEYIIKNSNGKEILQYNETVSIETQTNLLKRFTIPLATGIGEYVLYVKAVTEEGKIASGSDTFRVISQLTYIFYIFLGILVLVMIVVVELIIYLRKRKDD
jgi:hypothetical protein